MAKLSPDMRLMVTMILAPLLGSSLAAMIAVGIFQIPSTGPTLIAQGLASMVVGGIAGLFLLSRTRPRLAAVLWAGVWALAVGGLIWITEALLSGGLINLEISGQAAIGPLLAALITWVAAYRWYRQHPVVPATERREPQH